MKMPTPTISTCIELNMLLTPFPSTDPYSQLKKLPNTTSLMYILLKKMLPTLPINNPTSNTIKHILTMAALRKPRF
jgi:hypothetical protein